jgi:hypothetical protein
VFHTLGLLPNPLHTNCGPFASEIKSEYKFHTKLFSVIVKLEFTNFILFPLLHIIQTGSGVHPSSYPVGTGVLSPGGKAAGA